MGRKIKIENDDPIIKKNAKLEKRKKDKAYQRKILEEQKEKERKMKLEYNQIREMVIKQEQESLKRMVQEEEKQGGFLESIGVKKSELLKSKAVINKKVLPKLSLPEMEVENREQLYEHHFVQLQQQLLEKVQKKAKLSTNEIVKNELRQLFGKQITQQTKIVEQQNQQYKIKPQLKLASQQYRIGTEDYIVSNLALKNKQQIPQKKQTYSRFMSAYKDIIYIQNKEEETIDSFKKDFITHALQHIERSSATPNSNGFTKCRVLILTPFAGDADVFIDIIKELFDIDNIRTEKYTDANNNNEKQDEEENQNSDEFKISLKFSFNKGKPDVCRTKFYRANLIIASPLSLRMMTGAEGDQSRDYSFLSSIQILYIDRAQVIMMQNWLHLLEIIKVMNKIPKYQSLSNKIQTIRKPFLEEKGKFYRQNIVFSQYMFPELNTVMKKYFENWEGFVHKTNYYPEVSFTYKLQQQFFRIPDCSFQEDLQVRLDYFKRKIWSRISNNQQLQKFLILSSNPYEFVKIKSYLQKVNADADFVSEHTAKNKVQSRISRFNQGQYRILLLSERAYYFQVCQIEKIQNILFYSIPRNKWIYENLIHSLMNPKTKQHGASMFNMVIGMFSKFEGHAIQRIIGTERAIQIMSNQVRCDTFVL